MFSENVLPYFEIFGFQTVGRRHLKSFWMHHFHHYHLMKFLSSIFFCPANCLKTDENFTDRIPNLPDLQLRKAGDPRVGETASLFLTYFPNQERFCNRSNVETPTKY